MSVGAFVDADRPIAAVRRGPWMPIQAGGVSGHAITAWPSPRIDLRNAGATWVDETVLTDGRLATSRKPDDLPAFRDGIVASFDDVASASCASSGKGGPCHRAASRSDQASSNRRADGSSVGSSSIRKRGIRA